MTQLLLVHGQGLDSRSWDRVLPHLSLPPTAMDLPDHGDSDQQASSLEQLGQSVLDARATMEGPVVAVGHSLGASAVLEAVIADPTAFSAVVLVSLPCEPSPEAHAGMEGFAQLVEAEGRGQAVLELLVQIWAGPDLADEVHALVDTQAERLVRVARCLLERRAQVPRLPKDLPLVHLVFGDDDVATPLQAARPLVDALGGGLSLLPGRHLLPLEQPQALARLIERIAGEA